jgi:RNA polymerase-binding transcription factor DksA
MKTPFELFYCESLEKSGWAGLIMPFLAEVEKYNENKKENDPNRIYILQIKEKFGGLRIYLQGPKQFQDMADKAEENSYHICMDCGSPINVGQTQTGWIRTICKDCAAKANLLDNWKQNTITK